MGSKVVLRDGRSLEEVLVELNKRPMPYSAESAIPAGLRELIERVWMLNVDVRMSLED